MIRLGSIHNVGVVVDSLREFEEICGLALRAFPTIQRTAGGLGDDDADIRCRTSFLQLDNALLEGIQPLPEDRPVNEFRRRRGPGFYRVLFHVDDYDAALRHLERAGIRHRSFDVPTDNAQRARMVLIAPRATAGLFVELADQAMFDLVEASYQPVGVEGRPLLQDIAVAVPDIDEAIAALGAVFELDLAWRGDGPGTDEATFITGDHRLRFVSPRGDAGVMVERHLRDHGPSLFRLGLQVPDLYDFAESLREADVRAECRDDAVFVSFTGLGRFNVEAREEWPR